jgi:hypothetical protein
METGSEDADAQSRHDARWPISGRTWDEMLVVARDAHTICSGSLAYDKICSMLYTAYRKRQAGRKDPARWKRDARGR